jgi:hypothetical protein
LGGVACSGFAAGAAGVGVSATAILGYIQTPIEVTAIASTTVRPINDLVGVAMDASFPAAQNNE